MHFETPLEESIGREISSLFFGQWASNFSKMELNSAAFYWCKEASVAAVMDYLEPIQKN